MFGDDNLFQELASVVLEKLSVEYSVGSDEHCLELSVIALQLGVQVRGVNQPWSGEPAFDSADFTVFVLLRAHVQSRRFLRHVKVLHGVRIYQRVQSLRRRLARKDIDGVYAQLACAAPPAGYPHFHDLILVIVWGRCRPFVGGIVLYQRFVGLAAILGRITLHLGFQFDLNVVDWNLALDREVEV